MKRSFLFFIISLFPLFFLRGEADFNENEFSEETFNSAASAKIPFTLAFRSNYIQRAAIDRGFFKKDEIDFAFVQIEAGAVIYYNPTCLEAANAAIAYTRTHIDWIDNFWFEQSFFNTVSLKLGGVSQRLTDWKWQGLLSANIDVEHCDFYHYVNYDSLLWGRYAYREDLGLHIGFIAETGMKMNALHPILGFDWRFSPSWKLNLVFPVSLSLDYYITPVWSLALAGRIFNSRHRVGFHDSHGGSLIQYTNSGIELKVAYQEKKVEMALHIGSTLGGKLRVADRHNRHPHTVHFASSLYVGGDIILTF